MPAPNGAVANDAVGVVVIGRNESAGLADCLDSLRSYHGRIVYADSASTDGSREIARRCGAFVVEVDESEPLTAARGRNEGFAALMKQFPACEFVQFVDGDGIVERGWIETGAQFLQMHERVAVVCGHVAEARPGNSVYNWLCSQEWKGAIGQIDACGGNAMVRVVALKHAGGFRADLVAGEEAELMARMRAQGWQIWRLDVPMVVHDADIHRFSDWWGRARRGGFSYANVWWLTKSGTEPLYASQLKSALFWVVGLPALCAAISAITRASSLMLLLPAAWLGQIARLAARRGPFDSTSWNYAVLIMLAKVPEAIGIVRYLGRKIWDAPK